MSSQIEEENEKLEDQQTNFKLNCEEILKSEENGDVAIYFRPLCKQLTDAQHTITGQTVGLSVGTPVAMAGGAGASVAAPLVARFLKGLLSK